MADTVARRPAVSCTVRKLAAGKAFHEPDLAADAAPAQAFCDSGWLSAWSQAFLPDRGWYGPMSIYSVAEAERPLGFIAFARQSVSGLRVSSLAGYYWPFRTACVRGDAASRQWFARTFAAYVSRRPPTSVLRFGPVSSLDEALGDVISALQTRGWRVLQRTGGAVFALDLADGLAGVESRASASLLKNLRYSRRRMDKQLGGVSCERHVLGPDSAALQDVLAGIESASWVARQGGETKFIGARNRTFWQALGSGPPAASQAVVWTLSCGAKPIAFSAHIETADTIYIVANSYDEEWKAHSPGGVLSLAVIADACDRGLKRIDWGQGDSGYKSRWGCSADSVLVDLMAFRPGLRGRLAAALARRLMPAWEPRP